MAAYIGLLVPDLSDQKAFRKNIIHRGTMNNSKWVLFVLLLSIGDLPGHEQALSNTLYALEKERTSDDRSETWQLTFAIE